MSAIGANCDLQVTRDHTQKLYKENSFILRDSSLESPQSVLEKTPTDIKRNISCFVVAAAAAVLPCTGL